MAMLALGYGERLEALHCNFTLRGEESDCDEAFVRELCTKLSVPLQIKHFDTRNYAEEKGISIEMAARELRYQWFRSFTEGSEGRKVVAVAHNADDQVETLLLNLSMGTGIRGLSGMPFIKQSEGIIRPLQGTPRALILDYLTALGQSYREDSSNSDTRYKRNLIRHQLIPIFEELNPSFRETTYRTIEHLRSTEALYMETIERYRSELLSPDGLDYKPLATHPERTTILFELLRPMASSAPSSRSSASISQRGRLEQSSTPPTHLLIHSVQLLELLPREEVAAVSLSIDNQPRRAVRTPLRRRTTLGAPSP